MRVLGKIRYILIATLVSLLGNVELYCQIDFSFQSEYSYLKGKDASSLQTTWMNPGYDYSGWTKGRAPFRYGDGTGGTELSDMQNGYSTLYLRSTFECLNKDLIQELTFYADYDDGFIIWINGVQALTVNAPSSPVNNSLAPSNHEAGTAVIFLVKASDLNLVNGTNYIAVQGFNVNLSSSDFYFDLEIQAETTLPEIQDTIGVGFSVNSGFYENPFSVILTSPDPGLQIIYTLDGSNPRNSLTGFTVNSPANLLIDPASSEGRPVTPSVIIRASLYKQGYKPSYPVCRTYIFAEKIRSQSWPGGGWPSYNVNGQVIDLDMDYDVVYDPTYSGQLISSLKGIPSVSIITDLKNLFDPSKGIYVNATGHGLEWERDCNAELVYPDGTRGFNVNAGLRIRGGYSRGDGFPKHAFRLFFREKYGNDKLRYPLFGDEGVDEFDKIDLRADQNYAWSNGMANNSMVREVFSRDTQRDMGQPYTRSRYYHLFLNGMYWGLFQSQERSEARYAESYFGGNEMEYDVVKVNTENGYTVEATDGNLNSWQRLFEMCQKGFGSNSDYFRIEGKDQNGKPVKGGEVMVDIDNLIDYMLVIFYTGNFDSPTASFMLNKRANNFYAIDDRNDRSKGFTFYTHDSEHSMFDEAHPPGIGLYENRVNIAERSDEMKMEVNDLSVFHPQWIHYKLSANPEYRIRFADRALKHLSGGGALSPEKSLQRLNERINEVDIAVVAESARWGDSNRSGPPYTKNNNWIPEVNKIRNNYIPYRSKILIDQLKSANLFPWINAPVIKNKNGNQLPDINVLNSPVTVVIENPNNSGTIYYTLNGDDPRKAGGGINAGVFFSLNNVILDINASTLIKARVLSDGEWSAIQQVSFLNPDEDFTHLKITELHYHPSDYIIGTDTTAGQDLEFIEFKNTGTNSINLTGLAIDSAVHYIFPENVLLPPRQFYVVASKPSKFHDYYGYLASGNFSGNFSNAGERILVKNQAGKEIIDFRYMDAYPWPEGADGDGFTLSSAAINPAGNPGDPAYWTLSVRKDGTPFADNIIPDDNNPDQNTNGYLLLYPNPSKGLITVQMLTDEEINDLEIRIYNTTGKLMLQTKIGNPGLIDLSAFDLPAGLYIVNAKTASYSSRSVIILTK